jgi:hypothetical protein
VSAPCDMWREKHRLFWIILKGLVRGEAKFLVSFTMCVDSFERLYETVQYFVRK